MNQPALVVPICLFALTSCSTWETSEPELERPNVTAPLLSVQEAPSLPAVAAKPTAEKPLAVPDREEIRRLQVRLKQAGFDPGPADGVAGARTKAAFVRLQSACSSWQSMRGKAAEGETVNSERNFSGSPQDVRLIQTQLRSAGFDSGPIDGVFGARTKAALVGAREICPTAGDFAGILAEPVTGTEKQKVVPASMANSHNSTQIAREPNQSGARKQGPAAQPSSSQEEIRILQLRLRDAGFDPGPFDGVMGPKTKLALQQYEASQHEKKTKISLSKSSTDGHY